jgi:hypothetical protein
MRGVRHVTRRSLSSVRHCARPISAGRRLLSGPDSADAPGPGLNFSSSPMNTTPVTVQAMNPYRHCLSVMTGQNVVTSGASENVVTTQAMMPATYSQFGSS